MAFVPIRRSTPLRILARTTTGGGDRKPGPSGACNAPSHSFPPPAALADLNNLFEADSGVSADFIGGEVLRLSEYRVRRCPMSAQERVRFRRVPVHEESPPITELEAADACFTGADFTCDGCVDPIDFNEFLIAFGTCG